MAGDGTAIGKPARTSTAIASRPRPFVRPSDSPTRGLVGRTDAPGGSDREHSLTLSAPEHSSRRRCTGDRWRQQSPLTTSKSRWLLLLLLLLLPTTSRCGADHPMPIDRFSCRRSLFAADITRRDCTRLPSSDMPVPDVIRMPSVVWPCPGGATISHVRAVMSIRRGGLSIASSRLVQSMGCDLVQYAPSRLLCVLLTLIAAVRPGDRIINAYLVGADDHTAIATSPQSWRRDRWRMMVGWDAVSCCCCYGC